MENERDTALGIIRNAGLEHPQSFLVESFVTDAKDARQSAAYLLQACADDTQHIKFLQFVEDWKNLVRLFSDENPLPIRMGSEMKGTIARRDNLRCCITGAKGSFWNPPNVFSIIPQAAFHVQERRLYDILGAFIGLSERDSLLSFKDEKHYVLQNHWTLIKQAAGVFSRGEIRLEALGENKYEIFYNNIGIPSAIYTSDRIVDWECDLDDHSNSGIDSPNQILLEIHCRFSRALKWNSIGNNMKYHAPQSRTQSKIWANLAEPLVRTLLAVWQKCPSVLRLQTYRLLKFVGSLSYEESTMGVQRLPFGMYLKYGPGIHSARHASEFNALKLVHGRTSVPVPRPIDLIISPTQSLLVTSRLQGNPAGHGIHAYSDQEMDLIAQDMRGFVAELHAIKRPGDTTDTISNASGGPCLDYRIGGSPVGPFHNEKEFSESLRLGILPDLVHRHDHEIVFTHSDLNMRNILVHNGKISGIVDWENAGWFPDYWEYTKCHFGARINRRWLKMVEEVFGDKYAEELKIERQYWEYTSLV
ncbi:Protein kinase-like (PK-like) [Glarea lozoyensis ATCC 20868]|uniref:Protein kinase-like (PK-like) n=1 Tax=Glarea lozoyensis (strain ATCC 20868 / MF5171) TaxID=1116229 RepID=S3DMT7_GLAL2|nr:Protein kinase-like (PK-like) [Glarea lozoyensis ATCC 20868]EPE33411.1 Protein kinase-like (PK-like) [Glarea lozoyensis ATCC 20868]